MFKYKYNVYHLKYMKDQIWECKDNIDVYSTLSEFEHEQIKNYVPIQPVTVLDLGCGLGRASIYLNYILNRSDIHYILADTTGDTEITGGWDKQEFYNKMDLTASFCTLNNLLNIGLFDTQRSDWDSLSNIDYVMSRCAFGMHFPIESIMDKLLKITTPNVTMIFGTRNRAVYSHESFKDLFKEVYFIEQEKQEPYPQQDWLILKGKI
jgi:SAM-dependent methyltransferase